MVTAVLACRTALHLLEIGITSCPRPSRKPLYSDIRLAQNVITPVCSGTFSAALRYGIIRGKHDSLFARLVSAEARLSYGSTVAS